MLTFSEPPDVLRQIISDEALKMSHVNQLHPHTSHYVIPENQKYLKMYGVIIFHKENRVGAEKEADVIHNALTEANFTVLKKEWMSNENLHEWLDNMLEKHGHCGSTFFFCLLSHGSEGKLYGPGKDDSIILNDLLLQLDKQLPTGLPVVSSLKLNTAAK